MPGVPQLPRLDDRLAETTTLVVAWPASRLQPGPNETLAQLLGPAGADDRGGDGELQRVRLLAGLAGVCITLGRLHGRHGVAHRQLTPDGLIRQDDGRLILRDLGLAARTPGRGEAPTAYQAPEQRSGSAGPRPGSATDVYQVAAVANHQRTGCGPVAGQAPPIHRRAPSVPATAAEAIDAALAPPPDQRPEITALAVALRTPEPGPT
jgi:serine/threonine protein kinase